MEHYDISSCLLWRLLFDLHGHEIQLRPQNLSLWRFTCPYRLWLRLVSRNFTVRIEIFFLKLTKLCRYTGQVLDEVPMVYTSTAGLYTLLICDKKPMFQYWLAPFFALYNVAFTLVYLFAHEFFVFFLIMYILGICGIVLKCGQIYVKKDTLKAQQNLILAAVGSYLGGFFFFWLPENFFCSTVQIFRFHAWWHTTSCIGSYLFMVFTCYELEKKRGKNPKIEFDRTFFIPIPYVSSTLERAAKVR